MNCVQYHQDLMWLKRLVLISDALYRIYYHAVCVIYILDEYIHLLHLLSRYAQRNHSMSAYLTEKPTVRVMCLRLTRYVPCGDDDGVGLAPLQPWRLFQTSLKQQEKAWEEYGADC